MSLTSWLEQRPVVSWFSVLSYALLIFYISSIPYFEQPFGLPSIMAIVEHFLEYLLFGFLMLIAFKSIGVHGVMPTLFLSSFYGLMDEVHQHFVPGRNADLLDLTSNVFGCLIGVFIAERYHRKGKT